MWATAVDLPSFFFLAWILFGGKKKESGLSGCG